jgi:LAS superfamily LD-carboxypeptidase LdcB
LKEGELTGQLRTHIAAVADPACHLHLQAVTPFLNLRNAAHAAGIDLVPVSSFRDFDRQLAIWNGKYSGERPMLALPGASRHHWGTDLDLIDGNANAVGLKDKLTREAFAPQGPFGHLHRWLDEHAARFGFFRPYQGVRSGVQPEPWHFSFAPVAEKARRNLSASVLRAALAAAPLQGKDIVLARLDALHARYVEAIDLP